MSYIFSQALVEEYSPANCLGTDASVPSNANHTHKPCLWHDKTMEPSRLSRFGMTCAPFEANHGEELLMSFVAAFRAKTSAQPEAAQELTANDPDYGAKWPASSVRYDHASSSWKTAHCLLEEDLPWSSVILPKWGLMRNGHVFQHPTLTRPINATASGLWPTPTCKGLDGGSNSRASAMKKGLWPTPTVHGNYNKPGASKNSGTGLATAVKTWPTPQASDCRDRGNLSTPAIQRRIKAGKQVMLSMCVSSDNGRLNPDWVEWLMGWPIGWTDLKPLAMDKFHEWQRQHSPCFQETNEEQPA